MIRLSVSFGAMVRAFRDMTAEPADDGSVTRARVLATVAANAERRGALRRTWLSFAVASVVLLFASAAWTTAARFWGVPALITLETESASASEPLAGHRPWRVIPAAAGESGASVDQASAGDAELRAYSRAHRLHFVDQAPARALAAWDDYVAAYPRGLFAPEARYNRALCLVRLGRSAEAARALRPFARGRLGGYRQKEARLLLDWLK